MFNNILKLKVAILCLQELKGCLKIGFGFFLVKVYQNQAL